MPSKSPLRQLGQIINDQIEFIEARLAERSVDFPSLDAAFDPANKVESVLLEKDVIQSKKLIIAANHQLTTLLRHPAETIIDHSLWCQLPPAMRAISESHIVEIVREAGPQGIHAKDIATKANTDAGKTARLLRILANQFIFKEVSPDVFASNRLSSVLDREKSFKELTEKPQEVYAGTNGVAAFVNTVADEIGKAASWMPENFTDPKLAKSDEPNITPWNKAFNVPDLPLFPWYETPGNEHRLFRFGMAMKGTTQMEPADGILQGFAWKDLGKDDVIVDVGGGVGSSSLILAKANPQVKIVVQDREAVTKDADAFWKIHYPEAVSEGRVKFQGHDFFTPQPDNKATIYMLRFITHDWTNRLAKKILQGVRAGAAPNSKLIAIETIVPNTCKTTIEDEIPGAKLPPAPEPLLPSLGAANNMSFWWDMLMYNYCNAQDRTLGEFVSLAAESGWKVVQVYRIPGSAFQQYVAVPV